MREILGVDNALTAFNPDLSVSAGRPLRCVREPGTEHGYHLHSR
jgi:hypothetical protein